MHGLGQRLGLSSSEPGVTTGDLRLSPKRGRIHDRRRLDDSVELHRQDLVEVPSRHLIEVSRLVADDGVADHPSPALVLLGEGRLDHVPGELLRTQQVADSVLTRAGEGRKQHRLVRQVIGGGGRRVGLERGVGRYRVGRSTSRVDPKVRRSLLVRSRAGRGQWCRRLHRTGRVLSCEKRGGTEQRTEVQLRRLADRLQHRVPVLDPRDLHHHVLALGVHLGTGHPEAVDPVRQHGDRLVQIGLAGLMGWGVDHRQPTGQVEAEPGRPLRSEGGGQRSEGHGHHHHQADDQPPLAPTMFRLPPRRFAHADRRLPRPSSSAGSSDSPSWSSAEALIS